jgi:hypothetical protein
MSPAVSEIVFAFLPQHTTASPDPILHSPLASLKTKNFRRSEDLTGVARGVQSRDEAREIKETGNEEVSYSGDGTVGVRKEEARP